MKGLRTFLPLELRKTLRNHIPSLKIETKTYFNLYNLLIYTSNFPRRESARTILDSSEAAWKNAKGMVSEIRLTGV